jgi:hypothetical protein
MRRKLVRAGSEIPGGQSRQFRHARVTRSGDRSCVRDSKGREAIVPPSIEGISRCSLQTIGAPRNNYDDLSLLSVGEVGHPT